MSGIFTLTCRKFTEGCPVSGIGKNGIDDIVPRGFCSNDVCVKHIRVGEDVIVDYVQKTIDTEEKSEMVAVTDDEEKTIFVIRETITGLPVARVMTDNDGKSITTVFEMKTS